MDQPDTTLPRFYRMAPELRRSCWYFLGSVPVILAALICVGLFVQNRGPGGFVALIAIFLLGGAAMLVFLNWAVRVDEQGVARRRFFRWDLWPWERFAGGTIRKVHPYTFVDPDRPRGRRTLRLSCLGADGLKEVVGLINARYRLPPPPEVPESLEIKYSLRRRATFDAKGVHLLIGGWPHEYQWPEVAAVHITRMDPVRRDFKSLEILLPDHKIELDHVAHQGGTSPTWRGGTAEQVSEFLLQHVPEKIIEDSVLGEKKPSRLGVEKKLKKTKEAVRALRIVTPVCGVLLGGTLVWMAVAESLFKAIFMAGMLAVYPGSVLVFFYRQQRKKTVALEEMLRRMDQSEPNASEQQP